MGDALEHARQGMNIPKLRRKLVQLNIVANVDTDDEAMEIKRAVDIALREMPGVKSQFTLIDT